MHLETTALAIITDSAGDGTPDITNIVPTLFLADGRLVARDVGQRRLMVFSADGATVRALGRSGSGPGEWRTVGTVARALVLADDLHRREVLTHAVVVSDPANARVVVADIDRGAFSSFPNSYADAVAVRQPIALVGNRLWMSGTVMAPTGDGERASYPGLAVARVDTITRSARLIFRIPPRAEALHAMSIRPQVVFWRDHLVTIDLERLYLEWRDTAGRVVATMRHHERRHPITEAVRDQLITERIHTLRNSSSLEIGGQALRAWRPALVDTVQLRRDLDADFEADSLPLVDAVHLTASGVMWVVERQLPGTAGWRALAFSSDGGLRGCLVEPTGRAPLVFGDDRVLQRTEDEDGVAKWHIRRIRWPD